MDMSLDELGEHFEKRDKEDAEYGKAYSEIQEYGWVRPPAEILNKIQNQFLDELKTVENYGNTTKVLKKLGIPYKQFLRWYQSDKSFYEGMQEVEEWWLNTVEEALRKKIVEKGDVAAAIFYLKSKGRHKGYTDSTAGLNITGNNIQLVVKNSNKKKKLF